MLRALRGSTITNDPFKFEYQRSPATQVLRAADAALMFPNSFVDVDGDARVKAAVSAANNVQAVVAHTQALPPVSESPRTRNAPASMLAPFSGVSA